MTKDQNYYVIVGRDGTRAVSQWSPAQIDVAAARKVGFRDRRTERGSDAKVEIVRNELIDDTASSI